MTSKTSTLKNTTLKTNTLKVELTSSAGIKLDARLDRPADSEPLQFVVMCHCFTCTKETLTTFRVSRGLAQQGIGVLRFDFTGLGGSDGEFANTNFSTMVDDVKSAVDYLVENYRSPVALLGHSMGGTAALAAAADFDFVKSVVTVASPSHPQHVLHHFGKAMPLLEQGKAASITVAGQDYPVKPQFIDDVRRYDLAARLVGFDKQVLAIRAGKDALVGDADADEIAAYTLGHNFVLDLPGADHLFSDRHDTQQIVDEIVRWLK